MNEIWAYNICHADFVRLVMVSVALSRGFME